MPVAKAANSQVTPTMWPRRAPEIAISAMPKIRRPKLRFDWLFIHFLFREGSRTASWWPKCAASYAPLHQPRCDSHHKLPRPPAVSPVGKVGRDCEGDHSIALVATQRQEHVSQHPLPRRCWEESQTSASGPPNIRDFMRQLWHETALARANRSPGCRPCD